MRCWETVFWGSSPDVPTHPRSTLWAVAWNTATSPLLGGRGFGEAYLVFDALRVIIPHPLVALGSKGNLLAGDSLYFSSSEEVAYLKEQGRVVWEACQASRSHPSVCSLPLQRLQAAGFM